MPLRQETTLGEACRRLYRKETDVPRQALQQVFETELGGSAVLAEVLEEIAGACQRLSPQR